MSVLTVLVLLLAASPAFADAVVDAKLQCQMEYGGGTDQGSACQRGVELVSRAPDETQKAMTECGTTYERQVAAGACQRGVGLYTRVSGKVREEDRAGFSYSWSDQNAPLTVNVGPAQILVGDAERQMNRCLEQFRGSKYPPSCLSGVTAQQRPIDGPPQRGPKR